MSKITIYSTATCGFCKMLKSYLQSKDIAYEEKHADEDQKLAEELYEKSGLSTSPNSRHLVSSQIVEVRVAA